MSPPVSVVIRTLNENIALSRLLTAIDAQSYSGRIEVIVVDNESTDGTAKTARTGGATVVTLPRTDFSYPRSMNLGMQAATNEVVLLTVGHALPLSRHWISNAVRHFDDLAVAPLRRATLVTVPALKLLVATSMLLVFLNW